MVQTVGHRWLTVPTAAPNTYLNARQEEMELYLRRERGGDDGSEWGSKWGVGWGGIYGPMVHDGEPLWLFQHLSQTGLCFISADGRLSERSFQSSLLLTPPFLLLSLSLPHPPSVSLSFCVSHSKDPLLMSRHSKVFFSPDVIGKRFKSATVGQNQTETEILTNHSQTLQVLHHKR